MSELLKNILNSNDLINFIDNHYQLFSILDQTGRILYANKEFIKTFKYELGKKQTIYEFMDTNTTNTSNLETILQTNQPYKFKNGTYNLMSWNVNKIGIDKLYIQSENKSQLDKICCNRSLFIKQISHKLLQPLTTIVGYAELVSILSNLSDETKTNLQCIIKSAENMENIIKNLGNVKVHQNNNKDDGSGSIDENDIFNILYVEDNEQNMKLIKAILNRKFNGQCKFYEAYTGKKGIEQIYAIKPHILLLDLGLPDINGLDVYRETKSFLNQHHITTIVVSAEARARKIDEVYCEGVQCFIPKPIRVKKLLETIEDYLEQRAPL